MINTCYCDNPKSPGVQRLLLFGAVTSVAILQIYIGFFISLKKGIFRINAENFINRIMMSSKEAMLLFQQQEKTFVTIVPSNLLCLNTWENP